METIKKIYLLLCWGFFILLLSVYPFPTSVGSGLEVPWMDKMVHFFLYLVFSYLIIYLFLRRDNYKKILITAAGSGLLYALLMEVMQLHLPTRSYSFFDLLAGGAGVIAAFVLIRFSSVPRSDDRPDLLLHICCAGCGAYVTQLLEQEYNVTLFYYNPNIYPPEEMSRREKEAKKIAQKYSVPIIIPPRDHGDWLGKVKGYEDSPEGGDRCLICYRQRLERTAQEAQKKGLLYFTTTMTISPHKKAEAINRIGKELEGEYGVTFLEKDFKKQDGFKCSVQLSQKLGLYRQNYCGCEFSMPDS